MVKKIALSILLVMLLMMPVFAAGTGVYDYARLFSEGDTTQIEEIVNNMQQSYGIDVLVLTIDDASGQESRIVADTFILSNVGTDKDATLLLLNMDEREVYVSTSGRAIDILTDERIERILDAVIDNGMKDGEYADAVVAGLSTINTFYAAGAPADGYREEEAGPKEPTMLDGLAGAGSGGALGITHFLRNRKKYRMKTKPKPFAIASNSIMNLSLGNAGDRLIDTRRSSRVIPVVRSSSSSGGSSSGRSTTHRTGGGTFGGGGSKF